MSSTDPVVPAQISVPWQLQPGGLRSAPREPVTDSWRTQHLRVHGPDGPLTVRPARPGEGGVGPDVVYPGATQVQVLTTWNACGLPTSRADNTLTDTAFWLTQEHLSPRPAIVYPPLRQWVEPSAVVIDHPQQEVIDVSRRFGQLVVLLWDEHGLRPVTTCLRDLPGLDPTPTPVVVELAQLGCPMRTAWQGPCRPQGGPYGQAAMNAAYQWQQHQAMLLAAFGCPAGCGPDRGPADPDGSLYVPSRFGGWHWQTRPDDAIQRARASIWLFVDGLQLELPEWEIDTSPDVVQGAAAHGERFAAVPGHRAGTWGLWLTHSREHQVLGTAFVADWDSDAARPESPDRWLSQAWTALGALLGPR